MAKNILSGLLLLLATATSFAQSGDTLRIDRTNINTAVLKPGRYHYLVYFKMAKESSRVKYQFWTREIQPITYAGKPAIQINQVWEDNDTIFHTVTSVCDAKTFQPLSQESWWKSAGNFSFDFLRKKAAIGGMPLLESDTAARRKTMLAAFQSALNQPVFNWHLDLEVFSILPYRKGVTFQINFYDPGFAAPQWQYYTVSGSNVLESYNNQAIDCWLLTHNSPNNKETFWISKKTKEVLKLEQEFNGRYRYKIKLANSL